MYSPSKNQAAEMKTSVICMNAKHTVIDYRTPHFASERQTKIKNNLVAGNGVIKGHKCVCSRCRDVIRLVRNGQKWASVGQMLWLLIDGKEQNRQLLLSLYTVQWEWSEKCKWRFTSVQRKATVLVRSFQICCFFSNSVFLYSPLVHVSWFHFLKVRQPSVLAHM